MLNVREKLKYDNVYAVNTLFSRMSRHLASVTPSGYTGGGDAEREPRRARGGNVQLTNLHTPM